MTQNPKELAKQGDPQAIAAFINRSLKSKGIEAEVTRDDGYLRVMLTSAQVPPQEALVSFIRNGMSSLGVNSIHTVQVSGYHQGDDFPVWEEEIELLPSHEGMLFDDDGAIPPPPPGSEDDETLETYSASPGEYVASPEDGHMAQEYDDEDDAEEIESIPPAKKKISPLLIIVPLAVLAVLVVVGYFFKDKIPFLSSYSTPVSETSPSPDGESSLSPSPSPETPETTPSASVSPSPKPTTSGTPKPSPKPTTSGTPKPSPKPTTSGTPKPTVTPSVNPWREGVNKAQQAANLAQQAKTPQQWAQVATTWQQAINFMKKVPPSDPNHAVAQKKAVDYQTNLAYAKRNAGL